MVLNTNGLIIGAPALEDVPKQNTLEVLPFGDDIVFCIASLSHW